MEQSFENEIYSSWA